MKTNLEVQYSGHNVSNSDIEKKVKEDLKAKGIKMNTVDTLNIYYKPEGSSIYYVATTKKGDTVENEEALNI